MGEHSAIPKKSVVKKMVKGKKRQKGTSKTKFEEYLEMVVPSASISTQEDLELERKLAKKLKVKDGRIRGDDSLNALLEGIPSVLDSSKEDVRDGGEFSNEGSVDISSIQKRKKKKSVEEVVEDENLGDSRAADSVLEESCGAAVASQEVSVKALSRKRRRKRKSPEEGQECGIENETALAVPHPVESRDMEMTVNESKYVAPHLRTVAGNESQEHTIRKRVKALLLKLSESNVERITAEMASIFRSASMACLVGMDFGAKLMASLAKSLEDENMQDLALLLSYLCIFGVCACDLIYDYLIMLGKRLTEIDVSIILKILQGCGMKIRGDDPAAMKEFVISVQKRVNELKASSGDGQIKYSKRMEHLLESISNIKNNKKREDTAQHTRINKWLQKLRVENILIRGLKWSKLLDPEKKGQWWLSGDMASTTDHVEEVASRIDKEVLEAQKMLQLAASQRMNTDARKAIFCIIMSGEDYIDAFEKLLRLDLPGKQDREIIRVLVECCLQEKVFNKYYTILASKLCEHDKNHKFTLQYCLWDQFKELESMPLLRSMHLAKFTTEMVASFNLSLAVLKTIDWSDPNMMTPKRIMHFRMLFEAIFEFPDKIIWNMFTRIAVTPELESLRQGIEFFVKEYVLKSNKKVINKFKVAKKALNNSEGVLM
ncbi:hypothetical protein SLEP1_g19342 [Rubroshorea leprosula]|nr:hypothetical protein SLEP1_g19342 [Rubroshorea leprosula]